MEEYLKAAVDLLAGARSLEAPYVPIGYIRREVSTVGDTVYVGYSSPNSKKSDATWAIMKVIINGDDISLSYATNISWDNKTTGIYV